MKKCGKCGKELKDNEIYCPACGTAIEAKAQDAPEPDDDDGQDDPRVKKLKDENAKRRLQLRDTEKRLADMEAKLKEREMADLSEVDKLKKLNAELEPKSKRAEALEAKLLMIVEKKLANIPEEKRTLIPQGLSAEEKLEYMETNAAFLAADDEPDRPRKVNANPPKQGPGGKAKLRGTMTWELARANAPRVIDGYDKMTDTEKDAAIYRVWGPKDGAASE